ncbi:hypothetical protein [Brevibacillus invocatus]|uniref:hypothetical protein n=1 Tax=Brevibacillus invocatus TaxID=173959 RepID=UPI0011CE7C68|nr:hypothetical protein [Brevibacillus invocatus]
MTLFQLEVLVAVAEHGHALSWEESIMLEQLSREPFILPMAGCERLIQSTCQALGLVCSALSIRMCLFS